MSQSNNLVAQMKAIALEAAATRRRPDLVRCTNCGATVRPVTQHVGDLRVERVFPVDERGWCPLCAWDDVA